VLGSGYSLSVGSQDVMIRKGAAVLWATNLAAVGQTLGNTNIKMGLRMTPSGNAGTINARVYRRIAKGAIGQKSTTTVEQTAVDPSGIIGSAGNAALGVVNQASGSGSSVSFGNLQVFILGNSVLDDFNANNGLAGWTTFAKDAPDSVTEGGGQVECKAYVFS